MVRAQTLPFGNFSDATPGQIVWVFLNQFLDYEERRNRIHLECQGKFDEQTCEVCGKPSTGVSGVPKELEGEIYRPGEEEVDV